jgi:hypothetical protein
VCRDSGRTDDESFVAVSVLLPNPCYTVSMTTIKIYTEIEIILDIDSVILTHEMSDEARQNHLAQEVQESIGHTGAVVTQPVSVHYVEVK